jgi:hypothetical protein
VGSSRSALVSALAMTPNSPPSLNSAYPRNKCAAALCGACVSTAAAACSDVVTTCQAKTMRRALVPPGRIVVSSRTRWQHADPRAHAHAQSAVTRASHTRTHTHAQYAHLCDSQRRLTASQCGSSTRQRASLRTAAVARGKLKPQHHVAGMLRLTTLCAITARIPQHPYAPGVCGTHSHSHATPRLAARRSQRAHTPHRHARVHAAAHNR